MPFLSNYTSTDSFGDPSIIQTVISNPQVEPLHGLVTIDDLFDRFPEAIYTKSKDSLLYAFLSALCGDSGAGILKKQSYNARLINEGEYFSYQDLDTFATIQFRFKRLPSELYPENTSGDALTPAAWRDIQNKDSHFRHRLQEFFKATRLGTSPEGMKHAAQAGSGLEVEVIENYKHVFDQYSDDPLGIQASGRTASVDEFILQGYLEDADGNLLETSADQWQASTAYEIGDLVRPTEYGLGATNGVYVVTTKGTSDPTEPVWPAEGEAAVTNGTTAFEWYDRDYTPSYTPSFERVPTFTAPVTSGTSRPISYVDGYIAATTWGISGTVRGMSPDIDHVSLHISRTVRRMSPDIERNMIDIMDKLRPWGAFMSTLTVSRRHEPITLEDTSPFATSERIHVNRFVTGRPEVKWPTPDAELSTFIIGGEEAESIHQINNAREIPAIFQTIEGIAAYNDRALLDPYYNTEVFFASQPNKPSSSRYHRYISYHTGPFLKTISSIYTFLKTTADNISYLPIRAVAKQNTPLTMIGKGR